MPPAAADDAYSAVSGATLAGPSVLANDTDPDGDALGAVLALATMNGTLALASDGTFTYTPEAGFTGRDAFTYRAWDGTNSSAPATATITVVARPSALAPPAAGPIPAAGAAGSAGARGPAKLRSVARPSVPAGSTCSRGSPRGRAERLRSATLGEEDDALHRADQERRDPRRPRAAGIRAPQVHGDPHAELRRQRDRAARPPHPARRRRQGRSRAPHGADRRPRAPARVRLDLAAGTQRRVDPARLHRGRRRCVRAVQGEDHAWRLVARDGAPASRSRPAASSRSSSPATSRCASAASSLRRRSSRRAERRDHVRAVHHQVRASVAGATSARRARRAPVPRYGPAGRVPTGRSPTSLVGRACTWAQ